MKKARITIALILGITLIIPSIAFALSINKPTLVSYEIIDSESVKINFNSNNTNKDYKIQLYNSSNNKSVKNISITKKSYTLKGLKTNTTYNIIARVYSNSKYSAWSSNLSVRINNIPPTIKKIDTTKNTVKITYSMEKEANSIEIYNVTTKKTYTTTNQKEYTVTGLTSNKTYEFMIRSKTGNLLTSWTPTYTATTKKTSTQSTKINYGKKLAETAKKYAWPAGTSASKYGYSSGAPRAACKKAMKSVGYTTRSRQSDCGHFVDTIVRTTSGVKRMYPLNFGSKYDTKRKNNGWKRISKGKRPSNSMLKPGDVIMYGKTNGTRHTVMYIGNGSIAEAGLKIRFGRITNAGKIRAANVKTSGSQAIEVWRYSK